MARGWRASRSPLRGPARLLLATLAAFANESGVVEELSTDELCRAAGLANSTYRRARSALLACGEVELVEDGGGRGRMNRWRVVVAAGGQSTAPVRRPRRRAPVPGQPPLLSPVQSEPAAAVASQRRVAARPARCGRRVPCGTLRRRRSHRRAPAGHRLEQIRPTRSSRVGASTTGRCWRWLTRYASAACCNRSSSGRAKPEGYELIAGERRWRAPDRWTADDPRPRRRCRRRRRLTRARADREHRSRRPHRHRGGPYDRIATRRPQRVPRRPRTPARAKPQRPCPHRPTPRAA